MLYLMWPRTIYVELWPHPNDLIWDPGCLLWQMSHICLVGGGKCFPFYFVRICFCSHHTNKIYNVEHPTFWYTPYENCDYTATANLFVDATGTCLKNKEKYKKKSSFLWLFFTSSGLSSLMKWWTPCTNTGSGSRNYNLCE